MKHLVVDRITVYPFSVKLKSPFKIATMVSEAAEGVFVRVETSGGVVGWGEASPLHSINGETQGTMVETLKKLGPSVKGLKVMEIARLGHLCQRLMPGQEAAHSALEMAFFDAASRAADMPLATYLGGTIGPLETDVTIGIVGAREAAVEAYGLVDRGVSIIKVKVGSGLESDLARVKSIRGEIGSEAIRIDANQGYVAHGALELLRKLEPYDIEFCEQPLRRADFSGMKWLHGVSPIPIMADESCFGPEDAMRLAKEEACGMVNVKLSKSGGIRRGLQVATIAHEAGMPCMVGGMVETRLGVAAAAHMGCAHQNFRFFDLDAYWAHEDDVIEGGIEMSGGMTIIPEEPGLGCVPDPAFMKTLDEIEAAG